jgi:dimethylargininase
MHSSEPTTPDLVVVRQVSQSYASCVRPNETPIDVERARRQHAAYVSAFKELGVEVQVLPALDELPDACFVEDVAVLLSSRALLSRPGVESRQAEADAIEAALGEHFQVQRVEPDSRLDGGDVMRAGSRFFVGRSTRTDATGVRDLGAFAASDAVEVVEVEVEAGLHLKSACTVLDDHTLLYVANRFDLTTFERFGFELIEAPEPAGANVLAFGGAAMVSAAAPKTNALLRARGLRTHAVDISEFHTGDAALSCLSLRRAPAGTWTT